MIEGIILSLTAFLLLSTGTNGFALSSLSRTLRAPTSVALNAESNRRSFVKNTIQSFGLLSASQLLPANAVMSVEPNVFTSGKNLGVEEAKARFQEGRKSLKYLLDNYDKVVEGGGDNVRRYLGTVGTTSGLFGISKVLKSLKDEADDIVEYTEQVQELEASIRGADSAAYMAIFVTTSSSGTPPEKYFADAKIEANRALKAMDELAEQINVK